MQALLLLPARPAACCSRPPSASSAACCSRPPSASSAAAAAPIPPKSLQLPQSPSPSPLNLNSRNSLSSSSFPLLSRNQNKDGIFRVSATAPFPPPPPTEESEKERLAQVSMRLEKTSRYFKRLGSLGFWGQLVCTIVAAAILSFSAVITGKISSPATFYATAGGIAAAFVSVFWSFSYIRLSERLRRTASDPSKAPPRAEVVKSLKNGIVVNLLGMGAAVLGMQATVGSLVVKALTSSSIPYYQGISPGQSPVLGLDVFLVQASANTILSHFLGLFFSLELLRSVTLPDAQGAPVPKVA